MASKDFQSPGVSLTEIDLSQPTGIPPTGVPAGVIGTAVRGQAFVPFSFSTFQDFIAEFGNTDGEKFGPLAVQRWMQNQSAATYVRVLGAGDGKKRSTTTGKVTNAGFVVGAQQVQVNGLVGNNAYAGSTTAVGAGGGQLGRTYFLGCFMSESNGSTFFSDAGIQGNPTSAASIVITIAGDVTPDVGTLTITDCYGNSVAYTADGSENLTSNPPQFKRGGGVVNDIANSLKNCIENATYGHGVLYSSLTVDAVAVAGAITVNQVRKGTVGNTACDASAFTNLTAVGGANSTANQFDGGSNGKMDAQPILRAVLMAPSGVILSLSSTEATVTNNTPYANSVASSSFGVLANAGTNIGSVDIASSRQDFVMLINGLKATRAYTNVITSSFDPANPNYISKKFNSDPFKFEEAGHLLYTYYNIDPAIAVLTGSGIITAGTERSGPNSASYQSIGFLLTSSLGRDAGSASSSTEIGIPNFESFEDRFRPAFTPYVVSQKFGAREVNLFRFHALDDGAVGNDFKVAIANIKKGKDANSYGTFDVEVRLASQTDDKASVATFPGLTLDPNSVSFIGRVIGDYRMYFDFDKIVGSQQLVIEGTYPNTNPYVRVELTDDIKNGLVDVSAVPCGFRGIYHLVTSGTSVVDAGSILTGSITGSSAASVGISTDDLRRTVQPPMPLRRSIAVGAGTTKTVQPKLYWGAQYDVYNELTNPNKNFETKIDATVGNLCNYLPRFSLDTQQAVIGDNEYVADLGGCVRDADKFNNNFFTLERVEVITGSTDTVNNNQWAVAAYRRDGTSVGSLTNLNSTSEGARFLDVTKDFGNVGATKYLKFILPMQGGFDGLNIYDREKFKMTNLAARREYVDSTSQGGVNGPTIAAYRAAVDLMEAKQDVDIQLLAIPGLRHPSVTNYALDAVERRFDALYIMDIEEKDKLNTYITSSIQQPNVGYTVADFKNRALNSSFGAAFYPDVTVIDPAKRTNVQAPPSVAVLGAFGLNDTVGHPWFAPAGFARGALKDSEVGVKLDNKANLDELYSVDINPIVTYPGQGTGPVVSGQKTLLAAASALDRINVRRLLIYIRRRVREIARGFLFEPNRAETIAAFSAAVTPLLSQIQQEQGLDGFRVVIDTTTTTQADIENNTLRGKIFLLPTKAVEFVALDFVVSNAGAEA